MIPTLAKRHNQCRAVSHGADFYLTPHAAKQPAWTCYGTTAAQIVKLFGTSSDLHITHNWQEDEFEKPFYQLRVPEKHTHAFIAKLSAHGSIALVEQSSQLGADRESIFVCIVVVPRQTATATPDEDDDLL
jgi:hypothetical protein